MGEGMQHALVEIVSNLGFPIALSIYLLVRLENRMETLAERIKDLGEAIKSVL
jgi:hypothetical protein